MLPKQRELELPILRVLADCDGRAEPKQVYEGVKKHLPQLTETDLLETTPGGENKFKNIIRWARQALINQGDIDSPGHGIWLITEQGKKRLDAEHPPQSVSVANPQPPSPIPNGPVASTNIEELFDDYHDAFIRKVIQALLDLSPGEFEKFAAELLKAYGFQKVNVTNTHPAPDGGIDGTGELKVGLASVRAAFQCKRWRAQVGRPEIDQFRGAIQGQCEHGYLFTTSTFSDKARDASVKAGCVPIFLFDGREIVRIMIEKGLGVTRRPIEVYEDHIDSLFEKE